MARSVPILVCVILLTAQAVAFATGDPDDCHLTFEGSYRAAVKNRPPNLPGYTVHNNGQPISVSDWFNKLTRPLDLKVPVDPKTKLPRKPRTNTPAMKDIETIRVTLRAFLVAVKFERNEAPHDGKDNDFHVEIAGENKGDTDHVVVEVPPGELYCDAHKAVWSLAKADSKQSHQPLSDKYILKTPVQVDVEGYVFLDGVHARKGTIHFADAIGKEAGRGITGPGKPRRVRGLWEIHPVLVVRAVQ
jgi:hypothetical protein